MVQAERAVQRQALAIAKEFSLSLTASAGVNSGLEPEKDHSEEPAPT
jgi:hypothetical protein